MRDHVKYCAAAVAAAAAATAADAVTAADAAAAADAEIGRLKNAVKEEKMLNDVTGTTGMSEIPAMTMMMPRIGDGHGKAAMARADMEMLHKDMISAGPISHSALLMAHDDDDDVAVFDAAIIHARPMDDASIAVRAPSPPSIATHDRHLCEKQQQQQQQQQQQPGATKSFHDHFIHNDAHMGTPASFHSPLRPLHHHHHHEQQHLGLGDLVGVFHYLEEQPSV